MRAPILVAGLALALTALLVPAFAASGQRAARPHAATATKRPNIVFLMTDDQTLENMRVMPNVQRLLGEEGATFSQYVVSYSLCCPSRATMMTGQYAHNHRVLDNALPNGGFYRFRADNSLPVWLQDGGYYTAHVGKFLNGYGRKNPTQVPPGWNEWYTTIDPTTYRYWNYTMNENGRLVKHGEAMQDYITDFTARRAARIIRDHAESPQKSKKPLYLQVDFVAPHSGAPVELDDPPRMATPAPAPRHRDRFVFVPLPTPPNYNEADVKDKPVGVRRRDPIGDYVQFATTEDYQQRLESLLAVDGAVAAIVRALNRVGELENTYIFFSSDNGFFQGEHRIPSGKVLPYEESIHLPLYVRGPGIAPGTVLPQLVGNIDLAPTIAQMARVKPGVIVDGVSLLGLLKRRTWTETRDNIVLEAGPFDKPSQEYTGLRTSRYMFAVYGNGEEELYDLQVDPYELDNRAFDPAYTAVRAELTDRLQRLRFCAAANCRP
ncbi:MAG: sulfatase family protein [Gemmatirosa sp.]